MGYMTGEVKVREQRLLWQRWVLQADRELREQERFMKYTRSLFAARQASVRRDRARRGRLARTSASLVMLCMVLFHTVLPAPTAPPTGPWVTRVRRAA